MKGVWISNDNIPVQNVEFVDYVNERRLEFVNDKSIIVHYFEERNPEEIEQYNEHRVFLQKCESNEFIENQLL